MKQVVFPQRYKCIEMQGHVTATVVSHWRLVSHCCGLSSQVSLYWHIQNYSPTTVVKQAILSNHCDERPTCEKGLHCNYTGAIILTKRNPSQVIMYFISPYFLHRRCSWPDKIGLTVVLLLVLSKINSNLILACINFENTVTFHKWLSL